MIGHNATECIAAATAFLQQKASLRDVAETVWAHPTISESIKDCLRCGKCKPVCATHVPRANLLYSPRNKILGTSLLIEAFLCEMPRRVCSS